VIPVSTPLVRLYSEYMHTEYGDIDSGYVFVNLFAGTVGAAMTYPAVHGLDLWPRLRTAAPGNHPDSNPAG
jgi:integrase/recombinase XerD